MCHVVVWDDIILRQEGSRRRQRAVTDPPTHREGASCPSANRKRLIQVPTLTLTLTARHQEAKAHQAGEERLILHPEPGLVPRPEMRQFPHEQYQRPDHSNQPRPSFPPAASYHQLASQPPYQQYPHPQHYVNPPPPLPYPWRSIIDPDSGREYFFNSATNETSWSRPSAEGYQPRPPPAPPPLPSSLPTSDEPTVLPAVIPLLPRDVSVGRVADIVSYLKQKSDRKNSGWVPYSTLNPQDLGENRRRSRSDLGEEVNAGVLLSKLLNDLANGTDSLNLEASVPMMITTSGPAGDSSAGESVSDYRFRNYDRLNEKQKYKRFNEAFSNNK